ncbi:TonB-dependent receptor [Gillisia sp. M10.2A]|uniref:TonB-dependent receptor n=1 Tax=Gillisia lutea TaxID=2909668 RepID=A0ABS9EG12_9FLAO|nr:TonB-dependent receptor [Gillisia lutea]MCF4101828.1 TonB-dependent receptor [Gillisia lutea]
MRSIFILSILFFSQFLCAQTEISGRVVNVKGKPVMGANVFIEGTYNGDTSKEDGSFSFSTKASGERTLLVSFLSFKTTRLPMLVSNMKALNIVLKEDLNALDAVILNAGSFQAGAASKVSVLKPLDIVTTAGSAGNIIAALQTLPGTQVAGESGRLLVRGGEAEETQTYVDGLRVAQPYSASVQNVPSRGRFSPFLFKGISFQTGGYSAEYGEALSGVLLLNTEDEAEQNKTDISLMTVGLGIGNTQKWKNRSLSVNASYINLAPYMLVAPQNLDWNKPAESISGEAVYRQSLKRGLWKTYAAFDASRFDFNRESVELESKERIDLKNNNFYLNTSYLGNFGDRWELNTGLSYGYGTNHINYNTTKINNSENAFHLKLKVSKRFSDHIKLSAGSDLFSSKFDETIEQPEISTFISDFHTNIGAIYTEADILFNKNFALKLGVRGSYNDYLDETRISPRLSMAYKVSNSSQFSFAYGDFTQAPKADYLKYNEELSSEKASHYIVNYQFNKDNRFLRLEAYYKKYRDLVTYNGNENSYLTALQNSGDGYAGGLEVFYRDGSSIKNLEYWVSYSYIDSERKFKNYPVQTTPNFVANHTLSMVTKYWISNLRSQVGLTNTFSSGRPYNNPNQDSFMSSKTKSYNNLSLSWAYLLSKQKILYFSVSNVLGTKNVYGYEYASSADSNGNFRRQAITPTADRFFFVGFFWTISDDKKTNQLDNL